ncbi:MAG: hypothetical protein US81_C0023G0008 [Parcubacteria group bacterium GW2011_GWE2_38_18]|nr:MAG: hypothetical protein US81_C0023G0008 [Parcubacteria group bacterium GW2011_GWE2_38_18]
MSEFGKNKNPSMTYISNAVGRDKNIRYISKVFDIEDFKDFYTDKINKKVYEVIRESGRQEITAIYNEDTSKFSIRIQRFSKESGLPHCQSFSFWGGSLIKFIKFIESLDAFNYSIKDKIKLTDQQVDGLIERKRKLQQLINATDDLSSTEFEYIFKNLKTKDKIEIFKKNLDIMSKVEIENFEAAIKQKEYKKAIDDFEKLLQLEEDGNIVFDIQKHSELTKYFAGQPEKIFQIWLENNLWVFGVEYYKKHSFSVISSDGSKADLVMETADGFINLIELKRPKLQYELFNYDSSHRNYYPTKDFSQSISQCLIYLKRLEEFKTTLEKNQQTKILRPMIKLIIGRTNNFSSEEKQALRLLKSSLHGVDIISYDQILYNAKQIVSFYKLPS